MPRWGFSAPLGRSNLRRDACRSGARDAVIRGWVVPSKRNMPVPVPGSRSAGQEPLAAHSACCSSMTSASRTEVSTTSWVTSRDRPRCRIAAAGFRAPSSPRRAGLRSPSACELAAPTKTRPMPSMAPRLGPAFDSSRHPRASPVAALIEVSRVQSRGFGQATTRLDARITPTARS